MSVLWHYLQNGTTMGPIPEEQLRGLVTSGALRPSDQVWHEGMVGWTPIQAIPELLALAPQALAPKQPNKVLLWVLGGCGGLVVLALIAFVVFYLWVKKKVGNLQRNPAVAAAELIVRANPDLEVVSTDYENGTLTLRNRKTGETLTMDANDVKQGRLSFKDGKGSEIRFKGPEGNQGVVQVQGPNGQTTFGAGTQVQTPDWLRTYPGAPVEGVMSATGKEGTSGTVVQRTADAPAQVIEAFEKALKEGGFEVNTLRNPQGGIVIGEQKAMKRHVMVTVGTSQGQTSATVTFREQN